MNKKWEPGAHWPLISNQLFDQSAQRLHMLGKAAWGMIGSGIGLRILGQAAEAQRFVNMADFLHTLHAVLMAGGFMMGCLGLREGWKAARFLYGSPEIMANFTPRRQRGIRRQLRLGAVMCLSAILMILFVVALASR